MASKKFYIIRSNVPEFIGKFFSYKAGTNKRLGLVGTTEVECDFSYTLPPDRIKTGNSNIILIIK